MNSRKKFGIMLKMIATKDVTFKETEEIGEIFIRA